MAPPNAVSIVRELGIRQSGQPGSLAFLGPGDHAAPCHPGCAKTGHRKANRLAYFSSHLFDAASIYRCRAEVHARAAAPFDDSCDSRHLHAVRHNGKAKRAGGGGRALVPRKNAGNVSSAWTNSISCTYFVPTRKWSTSGKFLRMNGGDDETRTRDLCRDRYFQRHRRARTAP